MITDLGFSFQPRNPTTRYNRNGDNLTASIYGQPIPEESGDTNTIQNGYVEGDIASHVPDTPGRRRILSDDRDLSFANEQVNQQLFKQEKIT